MTEHPREQELEQYWRRTLSPANFLSVHQHVASCPRCAEQGAPEQLARDFEELRDGLLTETEAEPYHLSPAEIAAYRRRELSEIDLEIADSHLVTCDECRDATNVGRQDHVSQELVRTSAVTRHLRIAAAVAGVAILVLIALFLFRTRSSQSGEPSRVANTNSVPDQGTLQNQPTTQSEPAANTPRLVVSLNDGEQRITLDDRGQLVGLERLTAPLRQAVKSAMQAGRIERPAIIAQLMGKPGTLLGKSDNGLPFELIAPVGRVVESERPTFSWFALAGARSYTVSVTDAALNEVATSPPLTGHEWRITKQLAPGAIYSWQVTALKDGKSITSPVLPAPQAKFKVADREVLNALQQVRQTYKGSHLALGIVYAKAGLLREAERELRALVRDNPGDRVAREILSSVQAMNSNSNQHQRSSPTRIKPAQ